MTIEEVQRIARQALGLPYAFEIEDGGLHICFADMDAIAKAKGESVARQIARSGMITDKGVYLSARARQWRITGTKNGKAVTVTVAAHDHNEAVKKGSHAPHMLCVNSCMLID